MEGFLFLKKAVSFKKLVIFCKKGDISIILLPFGLTIHSFTVMNPSLLTLRAGVLFACLYSLASFAQQPNQPPTTDSTKKKLIPRPDIIVEHDPNGAMGKSIRAGKMAYFHNCLRCHGDVGQGIKDQFPPLAKADYLMADTKRAIKIVLHGAKGRMTVNQVEYNKEMEHFGFLNDKEIADLMNYIRNSWGNNGRMVGTNQVKEVRAEFSLDKKPINPELSKNR